MKRASVILAAALALSPPALAARATVDSFEVTPAANAAKVAWEATAKGIDGWAVEWASFSQFQGGTTRGLKPDARACTITGLKPGRVYTVRLYPYVKRDKTIARAALKGKRPAARFRVGKPSAGKPETPTGLTAVADARRVRVSWNPSPERHVAGYEIGRKGPGDEGLAPYARLSVGRPTPRLALVDGPALRPTGVAELLDTNVEEGKEYRYAVRAFTEGDPPEHRSDWSEPAAVTAEPYRLRSGDVALVYNVKSKNAGRIAANYVRARGFDDPQRVRVSLPVGAEISREDFDRRLLAPIQAHLRERPTTTILLLVRGVPWRIRPSELTGPRRYTQWSRASVDSELTLARVEDYPVQGRIRNPLYHRAKRLTPVDRVLAVCRLDGPDDRTANALVQRAIAAEQRGVEGIALFDARGLKNGSYAMGDRAILKAAELMKQSGRLDVRIDKKPEVVDLSRVKPKIGFYYGWYAGSFRPKNEGFRFGRGAIGAHLHSFAGYSLDKDKRWVGQMLWHGAAAAIGVADEPLLDGFPAADALVDALLEGRNLAHASLSASRYLSWMPLCVGDPLYTPFKPEP